MPSGDSPRNPFQGVIDYFSELHRMRELGTQGRQSGHEDTQRTHASAWVPTTDIYAQDNDLVIQVELAGVEPEEVDLMFAQGTLTISGSRPPQRRGGNEPSYYVRERFFGEFRRSVTLPEGTKQSQITATFDDGLVEVVVRGGVSSADQTRIQLQKKSREPTSRSLR